MTLRSVPLILLAAAGIATAQEQGPLDPIFDKVPFNRWLTEGDPTHFRWTTSVAPAELSSHQRLQTKVEIQVDGSELVSRRGHGELVMMIQFQDSAERVYQAHGVIDLQDVKDEAGKAKVVYTQDAFVLPGDYRVGMVIFDAKTGEHSAVQKTLHVNSLRNDPLPGAWKNLPDVEVLRSVDSPDDWFQPEMTGRLQLSLAARRPIRVEVLMNASASGPSRGLSVGTASTRSLANLIPALKVFSQTEVDGGGLHVTLLDIPKRRVIFEQDNVHELDWPRLRGALTEADPNKIDVRALEHREQNAQFFVEQVRQRLLASTSQSGQEPFHVLIVLSGPTEFSSGENVRPIELGDKPNAKVYYVRYHLPPERPALPNFFDTAMSPRGRRGAPAAVQPPAQPEPYDSLAPLLKPLQPRLFDVYSPEQFRKTLGSLLEEIARL